MNAIVHACTVSLGPRVARTALLASIAGLVALVAGCLFDLAGVALGALAASWLFFAGLAAGGVALSAAVHSSRGRWGASTLPYAEATVGFFPLALALLAILVLAAQAWVPGAAASDWRELASRSTRELVASAALFTAGAYYLRRMKSGVEERFAPTRAAVIYLLLYVATLSMWTVDFVMDLHEWAPSTVLPVFYFVGAFLAALAWTALLAARDSESRPRQDLAKLLFAFIIFWGYLLWAAYLPVWYGNLPEETGQLLARWVGGWKLLTLGVVTSVLVFPFFFLLPERTKRGRIPLAIAATSILAGLLGERFLLVFPSLALPRSWTTVVVGAAVTAGVAGAFVLSVGAKLSPGLPSPGAPPPAPMAPRAQ